MSDVAIRRARLADAEEIADILGEAFEADPVMNWVFGDARSFRTVFRELAQGLYLKQGFAHIIDGEAATLWLPAKVQIDLPILNEMRIAAAAFMTGGVAAVRRALASAEIMAKHHPEPPHYYLFAVGVRSRAQGKGIGGAILREGLRRADADGAAAYLENSNPRNTPLYERLGFAVTTALPLPPDAPLLLGMMRPSAGAAS